MALRWSKVSPQLALTPAVAVTLVAFVGAIGWTIYMSFTRCRRFPDYTIDPEGWCRQYERLFNNDAWATSLEEPRRPGARQRARHRLRLHPRRHDRAREARRGRSSAPSSSTRWRSRSSSPASSGAGCSIPRSASRTSCTSSAGRAPTSTGSPTPQTAMYGIILASIWHGLGFYMALMLAGPEVDQHRDLERGAARRRQLLAALRRDHHPDDEVHLPHLRHPALARRGQGLRHRRRDDQRRARAPRPGRRPTSPSTPIPRAATSASPRPPPSSCC